MTVSSKCYKQYCIFKKRNIILEERLLDNGRREYICRHGRECEKCRNLILPFSDEILKIR